MPEPVPASIVLDVSAAISLVRSEPRGSAIARVIDGHRAAAGRLLVPDHFWLEVANVLERRHLAGPEDVVEALQALDDLQVESIRMDRPLLLLTIDLVAGRALSAYDAAYLAVAQAEDARILTLDARLADAAADRAIRVDGMPPRRSAEEPALYGGEPIDWARFGPYLARLRAEAHAPALKTAAD